MNLIYLKIWKCILMNDELLVDKTIYLMNTMCEMMTNLHMMCQMYTFWCWHSHLHDTQKTVEIIVVFSYKINDFSVIISDLKELKKSSK